MTKAQRFKKEYSFELLKIAEADLETGEILLNAKGGRKENICFIAHQVVEKSVKAVLCYLEIPVPFSHSLEVIFEKVPEKIRIENYQGLNELTQYATIRRYEEGKVELDNEDLVVSIEAARKTVQWAKQIVVAK
jgi:HEPN domain-containing protein